MATGQSRRVSVIVPVYNGGWCWSNVWQEFSARRIANMLIVVDNGSKDNSIAICSGTGSRIGLGGASCRSGALRRCLPPAEGRSIGHTDRCSPPAQSIGGALSANHSADQAARIKSTQNPCHLGARFLRDEFSQHLVGRWSRTVGHEQGTGEAQYVARTLAALSYAYLLDY